MDKQFLINEIKKLKKEKNALILAHYYQISEIQEIADFVGDSLALARMGKNSDRDLIVVCGVKFMGESAKILSPEKTILLPREDAGCPMADMITYKQLQRHKEEHPEDYIISYVNTSADVKALTDVCVTSSNALKIVSQLNEKNLYFLPDKNLAQYINKQLPEKKMKYWLGFCATHERLKEEDILKIKKQYPNSLVLAHPECNDGVLIHADYIGSTSQIIDYAKESNHQSFIIATEEGVMHKLKADSPNKEFFLANATLVCKNMKKTSLEDLYNCLLNNTTEVKLDTDIIKKANGALERMLELSK